MENRYYDETDGYVYDDENLPFEGYGVYFEYKNSSNEQLGWYDINERRYVHVWD